MKYHPSGFLPRKVLLFRHLRNVENDHYGFSPAYQIRSVFASIEKGLVSASFVHRGIIAEVPAPGAPGVFR